ncbi:DUF397 domain-containing protein [Nocardiopsis sp. LOL_012]|uniref:DUF397 domain-containing protein n=1 Tax=Nocardiopsis sp. LOL_012 TaxID=3345409 RepID=UPI003A8A4B6E
MDTISQRTKVTVLSDGITTSDGFRKPRRSNSQGACVECRPAPAPAIRDTRNRDAGHLPFPVREWAGFLASARA